jgi:hypothetical protein
MRRRPTAQGSPLEGRKSELGGITNRVTGVASHYLRTMLERVADHPINWVEELFPWVVVAEKLAEDRLVA